MGSHFVNRAVVALSKLLMATYLLTWNPKKWEWAGLDDYIREIAARGHCRSDWSCGNTKAITPGDRVFPLRQELEPRGICGSGHADSTVYEDIHWSAHKADKGKVTRYVRVKWNVLLDAERESIFPREWLNEPPLAGVNWNTQISGIRIPDDVAAALEERWEDFLRDRGEKITIFGGPTA